MEIHLAHNWDTVTWVAVKSIFKTWSLYESMKELWLFTCLNTKTIVWGPNCQCDRSKVRCCPGSGPRGCHGGGTVQGPAVTWVALCPNPGVSSAPSGRWQRSLLRSGSRAAWFGPALEHGEGVQLQLASHLCCQNPLIVWTYILETLTVLILLSKKFPSCLSGMRSKEKKKSLSFSFLLNLQKICEMPHIVWGGAGLLWNKLINR